MTPRGAFIVFEGLDRCGKTTQVDQLAERLRREGRQVRCCKFPGESWLWKKDSRCAGIDIGWETEG